METISIFLPTLPERRPLLDRLLTELWSQVYALQTHRVSIEVLEDDGSMTIGAKRNQMMQGCKTDYFTFIDDDDMVNDGYVGYLLQVADSGADVGAMRGSYYRNGPYVCGLSRSIGYYGFSYKDSEPFERWMNRPADHLCVWRTELVKDIAFQDRRRKEDIHWAMAVERSMRIRTEYPCQKSLYQYLFEQKN